MPAGGRECVRFANIGSGRLLGSFTTAPVTCLTHRLSCWNESPLPFSHLALTGHADGKVVLWNVFSQQSLHILDGHRAAVCAITANRLCAVSAGEDATCRVWRFVDVHVLRKEEEEIQSKRKKVGPTVVGLAVLQHPVCCRRRRRVRKGNDTIARKSEAASTRRAKLMGRTGSLAPSFSSRRHASLTPLPQSIPSTPLRACWRWGGLTTVSSFVMRSFLCGGMTCPRASWSERWLARERRTLGCAERTGGDERKDEMYAQEGREGSGQGSAAGSRLTRPGEC
eukprot:764084-Hanusia_phi.AAC.2